MSEYIRTNYTQEDMLDVQHVKVQFPDEDFGYWSKLVSCQYINNRLAFCEILDEGELLIVPAKMIKAVR